MIVNKNTFVIGFMLFAIFFGAGNLIFPAALGMESGQTFWPALLGFVSTGVGLPLLGIIVSAYYQDGYRTALDRTGHERGTVGALTAACNVERPCLSLARIRHHGPRHGNVVPHEATRHCLSDPLG